MSNLVRTLNPDPFYAAPKTLTGLANYFGDRAQISSMTEHREYGSLPTLNLEVIIYPEDHTPKKKDRTVQDVYDEMTDEQKKVVGYLMEEAIKTAVKEAKENPMIDTYVWTEYLNGNKKWPSNCNNLSNWAKILDDSQCSNDAVDATRYAVETMNKENLKGDSMMEMFNGMFGKLKNGMCRLSMHGGIAVKTSNGYKTYNVKSGRLVNCSNFVFDIGEEFFFVIPTNKVAPGDIILISGKPKCVIETNGKTITVINYEDSVVETILPERHIFMGNTYFYGKIMSMFGDDILKSDDSKGTKKLMKYMMMSEMMKGMNGGPSNQNGMGMMLPFMMMNGGMGDIFGDIFDFGEDPEDDCSDIEDGAKVE